MRVLAVSILIVVFMAHMQTAVIIDREVSGAADGVARFILELLRTK